MQYKLHEFHILLEMYTWYKTKANKQMTIPFHVITNIHPIFDQ